MSTKTLLSRLGLGVALVLVLAAPMVAQKAVDDVRIAVLDPSNGQELAIVAPGAEISMAPGEALMFRVFNPQGNRKSDRQSLSADFGFGPTATPLKVTRANDAQGEAVIRLDESARPGQKLHIGYKLKDRIPLAKSDMQLGRIVVRVVSRNVTPAQEYYVPGYRSYGSQIDALVDAYYRGILMREPDPRGGADWRNELAKGGYDAVRNVAVEIARSEESVVIQREGRVTPEQRLASLYQNLLGMSQYDVDPQQWAQDLTAIGRGDVASVVDRIVRSSAFQYRFGFLYGR